jgi:hypothetical protein
MTAAQTLKVVFGLVNNMQVVMGGAHCLHIWMSLVQGINLVDGESSTDDIRETLGASS